MNKFFARIGIVASMTLIKLVSDNYGVDIVWAVALTALVFALAPIELE